MIIEENKIKKEILEQMKDICEDSFLNKISKNWKGGILKGPAFKPGVADIFIFSKIIFSECLEDSKQDLKRKYADEEKIIKDCAYSALQNNFFPDYGWCIKRE